MPAELNKPQLAQSAIGQYDVRATPLQVAMIAAGVANRGIVMRPYLVKSVLSSDLDDQSKRRVPQQLSQAVRLDDASALTRMMEAVVETGSRPGRPDQWRRAWPARPAPRSTATGKPPHAWFIGFAPADDPQVAVAVVVEDGGIAGSEAAGGRVAAPIAKAVMEAVIR